MPHELRDRVRNATARVIVRMRHERGLSQERLAELADIERTHVSFLERRLRTPGLELLVKLAKGLEIPMWRLVREIEEEIDK